jgi:hypothetical protein
MGNQARRSPDVNWHPQSLKWVQHDEGKWFYKATVYNHPRVPVFAVVYLGRTQVAFGGGSEVWRTQDLRPWVAEAAPWQEFASLDEAKAWVQVIVRMEGP